MSSMHGLYSVKIVLVKGPGSLNTYGTLFLSPNHNYCVAETGYLADKAGPTAPDREYSILTS